MAITGTPFADLLNGTAGADQILGLAGDDTLDGGAGDDTLVGGSGIDRLAGGAGNDTYAVSVTRVTGAAGTVFVRDAVLELAGEGTDTVYSRTSFTLPGNVENLVLTGAPFWRAYVGTGNELNNVITGEGAARHVLYGEAGSDTLAGGTGRDFLDGGAGQDAVFGNEGDDVLVWDAGGNDIALDGGSGLDRLHVVGADALIDLASPGLHEFEVVDLTGTGNNTLALTAAALVDLSSETDTLRVHGNAGDVVSAGAGWLFESTFEDGGETFARFTQGAAVLEVASSLNHDLDVAIPLSVLDGTNGLRLEGNGSFSVAASAGDVNGDGFSDLIVGESSYSAAGRVYVVFGGSAGYLDALHGVSGFDLQGLNGTNGFRLNGIDNADNSGRSVASAEDVNGDGYADIILGADRSSGSAGESYVVFGGTNAYLDALHGASGFNLSGLTGTNGFRLAGIDAGDKSGKSVASTGDVNGDGYADLIVGAYRASESYVVFGKASGFASTQALSSLDGANGIRLKGAIDASGWSVASAGDVNGDGYADLIIGAVGVDAIASGASYVVFGGSAFYLDALHGVSGFNLSELDGTNGFRLDGIDAGNRTGLSVAAAGDVNGDGFADVIVGAPSANGSTGETYVVFGGSPAYLDALHGASGFDLSGLNGTNGFRLDGIHLGDQSGFSVATAGDVNGDGYDDLIVGAYRANGGVGESYVVFGKGSGFTASLTFSTLDGANGFRLDGVDVNDWSGISVASAGDVNGDGYADLIVGARYASAVQGASYVVYGRDFTSAVDFEGTAGGEALTGGIGADTFVAGEGADTITGGGGADVFRGGEGDDRIVVPDINFFDVDGGTGSDTLALDGSGLTLDLALLADSKLTGMEIIELTGSGNNTLALTALDLLNLSDSSNTLRVDGNAGDSVTSTGQGWVAGGTVEVFPTVLYQSYTDGAATLLLDPDLVAASTIN